MTASNPTPDDRENVSEEQPSNESEPTPGPVEPGEFGRPPILSADGSESDSLWRKTSTEVWSSTEVGPVNIRTSTPDEHTEDVTMSFEVLSSDPGSVNLGSEVTGKLRGYEFRHGGFCELTPHQAEALAGALLEAAAGAREAAQEGAADE